MVIGNFVSYIDQGGWGEGRNSSIDIGVKILVPLDQGTHPSDVARVTSIP